MKDLNEMTLCLEPKRRKARRVVDRRRDFFKVALLSSTQKEEIQRRMDGRPVVTNDFELFRLRARLGGLSGGMRLECEKAIASLALLERVDAPNISGAA